MFSNTEGHAAFSIVTHMRRKNTIHTMKVGNNEELEVMIGMREENGPFLVCSF